jgi:hypothetical protein
MEAGLEFCILHHLTSSCNMIGVTEHLADTSANTLSQSCKWSAKVVTLWNNTVDPRQKNFDWLISMREVVYVT